MPAAQLASPSKMAVLCSDRAEPPDATSTGKPAGAGPAQPRSTLPAPRVRSCCPEDSGRTTPKLLVLLSDDPFSRK